MFVAKSPPHVLHVAQLARHFRNTPFLFMVRSPYAVCEGICRHYRTKLGADYQHRFVAPGKSLPATAATHVAHCLVRQRRNVEVWRGHGVFFTYEQMYGAPAAPAQNQRPPSSRCWCNPRPLNETLSSPPQPDSRTRTPDSAAALHRFLVHLDVHSGEGAVAAQDREHVANAQRPVEYPQMLLPARDRVPAGAVRYAATVASSSAQSAPHSVSRSSRWASATTAIAASRSRQGAHPAPSPLAAVVYRQPRPTTPSLHYARVFP